jgi:alginate O-acetyltransferase complex protein AlgI
MMGSASLQFIAYGLAVGLLSNLSQSLAWRQGVLLVASLGFLAFFSLDPMAFVPLASFLALGYLGMRIVMSQSKRAFVPFLLVGILAFVWLKKYAFIPSALFITHPYVTLGLSYIFFRVLHLIIDAHSENLPRNISVFSYLNYTLNFTTLVSGPIQSYQEFADMQVAAVPKPLNVVVAGHAIVRIIVGFFKVNVLSLFLSMVQANALNSLGVGGERDRVLNGALIVAVYPLYLYANFSGYIDIVIGIARFLRIELPENFDRPFSSQNFLIFWNRWHMTLSNWLKTYVYNPLLITCMERWPSSAAEPFIVVFAFFFTFFLIGVWHGQTSEYIFYGVLLGLGVSVTKLYQILMMKRMGRSKYNSLAENWIYGVAARGLTFTWFSFSLLWFWSNWTQLGVMAGSLDSMQIAAVWVLIFVTSSAVLAVWEAARDGLLSYQFEGRPFVLSRYARTMWCTALVVITVTTVVLLNAPAPDIVYKAF